MRKMLWVLALLFLVSALLSLPGAVIDPPKHLGLNINNKDYVWAPLRKLRIRMLIGLGGSPNDAEMGESIYATAVMAQDTWFLKKYSDLANRSVLTDGFLLACRGGNEEVITVTAQALGAGTMTEPPACPT